MAQTATGLSKRQQTMIKRYGSYEAYKDFMRSIAREGGKNGKGHQFAHGKVDAREAAVKAVQSRWRKSE